MQFDVETPRLGYDGTLGGVTFVGGRARVDASKRGELAYFRRNGYKVTPVEEPVREAADSDDPGSGPDPAAAGPDSEVPETSGAQDEPPGPDGETAQTTAEAAAQATGTPFEGGDGAGGGFDASALADATAKKAIETGGGEAGEQVRRPPKNAPVAAWTDYARHLGITDEELGGKTKNELVELVDEHETKKEAQ